MGAPVATIAEPPEWGDVFQLIFKNLQGDEREMRVENALHLLERGELDPTGVLVVRGHQGLEGALICLVVPGASGLVWPPQTAAGVAKPLEIEDCLLGAAEDSLRLRGVRLAQTLLLPEEIALGEPLLRNGFQHITSLWYMKHELRIQSQWWDTPKNLTFEDYRLCDHSQFHQTLARTYEQTLDCPEVNGVRTLEEVLEGHRAQGHFDPRHWWLALQADRPVGVLLLCEMPDVASWDLSYVGVLPEARGQGIGRALTHLALRETCQTGAPMLSLAVDKRNVPAWELYRKEGFEPFDLREVFLAVFSSAESTG